jgi:dihydroorotate dehydrogenase electron transfer subunit
VIIEESRVVSNGELAAGIHQIEFRSPVIASNAKPGQFVNILISDHWEPLLRRPMSVAGSGGDRIRLIYRVVGRGTGAMASWQPDRRVSLLGPLGNGWKHDPGTNAVLLGGGVGIAPILFLHEKLLETGVEHQLIMGARDRSEHFLEHKPKHNIWLTTDNGSLGVKGTVLDGLLKVLPDTASKNIRIFGCGPRPMLEALRSFVREHGMLCQIATEEVMGCGIGICQGCNVAISTSARKDVSDAESSYKLACIDGPVFWAHELV